MGEVKCGNCREYVNYVCAYCWKCEKCCDCLEKCKRILINGEIRKKK